MDDVLGKFLFDEYPDRKKNKAGFVGCLNSRPNLMNILKKWNMSFFTYMGSDTIPPCYENVRWFIYEKPLPVFNIIYNKLFINIILSVWVFFRYNFFII